MINESRTACQSCNEPKLNLNRVRSKIVPEWELNLCKECITAGFEPRWLIILAVRQFALNDKVRRYLKDKLYVGEAILAESVI